VDASGSAPRFPPLFSDNMEKLLGAARNPGAAVEQVHKDLAHSVQKRYEQALMHLLTHVAQRTGRRKLALAGGCAMNSVANGRIPASTDFESVFVHPAAGDAGGAVGAALCAERDLSGALPRQKLHNAALGPGFDDDAIARILDGCEYAFTQHGCVRRRVASDDALCQETAAALASGQVVGWFQGRMEWGPRALGQRSILADPRRGDMRELLNEKIKRREGFRPFAPSILREAVSEWFSVDDDVPFMMKVYPVREDRRCEVPAITHVDGTGRLQTVTRESNGIYYALISAFARATGVPMLLNTSFNENEPIVCGPQEAIDCFLRTRMDRLVLGRHVVQRGV
jgi:carbamoyltransferase